MNNPKSIPILVILFNRPDKSAILAKTISIWKPERIYISQDGARNDTEKAIVKESLMSFITNLDNSINYEVKSNNANLGCSRSIVEALDWAFTKEERLIILEDDCVPSIDFFMFCFEALNFYKNVRKVKYIGGSNLNLSNSNSFKCLNQNHYWTKYAQIWGWATWKDRWVSRSKQYTRNKLIKAYWWDPIQLIFWIRNRRNPLWDVEFGFLNLIESGSYGIIPSKNLIQNTGFDGTGSNYRVESKRNIEYSKENLVFTPSFKKSKLIDLTIFYKRYFPILFEKFKL